MGTVERARHELLIIQDCVWAGGGVVVLLYCMFISTVKMPAGISRRGVSERKWGGVSGVVVVGGDALVWKLTSVLVTVHLV